MGETANKGVELTLNSRNIVSGDFTSVSYTHLDVYKRQIMANLGEVQNQGFEIALNSTNIQNRNFTWNTSVGFSINKNKINKIVRKRNVPLHSIEKRMLL